MDEFSDPRAIGEAKKTIANANHALAQAIEKRDANGQQIGGNHYKHPEGEQHWDRVHRLGMNWYAANVTKYVERYPLKNGLEDLRKARHYLDKLIEVEELKLKYSVNKPVRVGMGAVMAAEPAPERARHPYERIDERN